MNILFAASECVPFVKTGGLGDVVGALPKALLRSGVYVNVILPKYEDMPAVYQNKLAFLKRFEVPIGWRRQYCSIEYLEEDGIRYYFLDNTYYFKRHGCYGYFDDGERFAFFSRAVLEALPHLAEKTDIIHCHDWQTGPICALLRSEHFAGRLFYQHIRTVFTIHNLKYQGIFPKSVLRDLLDLDERFFTLDGLEFYGNVSYLKAGLAYADCLTTVSRTYADEIQMPYYGEGLDGFLRWRSGALHGIVNGIDTERNNPRTDSHLHAVYNDIEGKNVNKTFLQKQLNLTEDGRIPVIAMVTRLAEQKGIDLVLRIFHEMMTLDVQFILLGTGDQNYEQSFCFLGGQYPMRASVNIFFDEHLAKKIYAASDLFLMPSKFEPCGIGQLLALRYGSLPVVRETGGLKDTVIPYNNTDGSGYGFSFANYNAHEMLFAIERALALYRKHPKIWNDLVTRAMELNFGWDTSADAYINLYTSLLSHGSA